MIKVVCIGFGNVNQHLCRALQQSHQAEVVQIFSRSQPTLPEGLQDIPVTDDLSQLKEAQVYLLSVPDDAIAQLSKQLPRRSALVAHTSGSVELRQLSAKNRRGVFYPLQTFSKNRPVDFSKIPICIEAEMETDTLLLRQLGTALSNKVVSISSKERQTLHLAAVFVNNFTNHLYHISSTILEREALDFDLLKPLIEETAKKVMTLSPYGAQTGPARRNDQKTIEKHLHLLPEGTQKELYQLVTQAIQHTYGKKL